VVIYDKYKLFIFEFLWHGLTIELTKGDAKEGLAVVEATSKVEPKGSGCMHFHQLNLRSKLIPKSLGFHLHRHLLSPRRSIVQNFVHWLVPVQEPARSASCLSFELRASRMSKSVSIYRGDPLMFSTL
jgi:hypothetical protein